MTHSHHTKPERKNQYRTGLMPVAALAAMSILLSACAVRVVPPPRGVAGNTPAATAEVAAPGANALSGTSWTLATLGDQPPVAGTFATLNFGDDGHAGGNDSCNGFRAPYGVDGGSLTFGLVIGTLMACDEPIMAQADAFQKVLGQTAQFAVTNGNLTLSDAAGAPLAMFEAQSTELAGTSWVVTGYNNGKQAVVGVLGETTLSVSFGDDGSLNGDSGCNRFFGPYEQQDGTITIGPLAGTRKYCAEPAGVMDQEMQLLMALESAATYRLDGNTLDMRTADDALAATLRRAP